MPPPGKASALLENGAIEVNAIAGENGIEERTKSVAGWRVIALPPSVVDMLRRRIEDASVATHVALSPPLSGA